MVTGTLDRAPAAAPPAARARRPVRRLGRGTPGRLALALVALVTLGLATGAVSLIGMLQRADLIDQIASRSGRLSIATQNLYRALSDADATAASAFLSNGLEPAELRQRYETDISDATAALAVVSTGAGGSTGITAAAAKITAQLPIYTGLVETARVYNRQGLPLGPAYLREASGVMRERLLPAAEELYAAVSAELDRARAGAGSFPWFAFLLGLLTVAGLGWAQVYLTRRTNRLLNVGLVLASAAALVLLAWLGVSAVGTAGRLEASRVNGSAQVDLLTQARIAALQARADESLTLVARGNGARSEADYVEVMKVLAGEDGGGGLLARARAEATDEATRTAVATATDRSREWLTAHKALRDLDNGGNYTQAVAAAIGTGPNTTAQIFSTLDGVLAEAITHNGERFTRETDRADRALRGLDIGIVLLTLLLTVGAAYGIQRRMAEYR
jgi:hypothetical protein